MTNRAKNQATRSPHNSDVAQSALPTLLDHLRELQGRLFSTLLFFLLAAGAAYPFFDKIAAVLMAPLKKDQELVYLTPGGAFSFIIKVCVYIGIIAVLPIIIFHIYRFVMPAVKKVHLMTVLKYTAASFILAMIGIVFAYFVSLPASLYFLTSFELNHINPMLTIDSYFSFVMTYLLAGAILFQLPLIMLIINTTTPLTPKKLMSYQRHMILVSFIVAAVISPTPDALNQTLLASPVVVMYQVGIVLIMFANRKRHHAQKQIKRENTVVPAENGAGVEFPAQPTIQATLQQSAIVTAGTRHLQVPPVARPVEQQRNMRGGALYSMDIVRGSTRKSHLERSVDGRRIEGLKPAPIAGRLKNPVVAPARMTTGIRTIDGVFVISRTPQ